MVLALLAVLAAGQPQRFNKAKLLEVRKGQPLILHALAAAREACPDNVSFLCTLIRSIDRTPSTNNPLTYCDLPER